jgi:ribonuclease Z
MLKAMVVGAGGSAPPSGYGGPSLLLSEEDSNVLIDCGENCVSTLTLNNVDVCKIDYVYITHVHIDHWAGLPSLGVKLIERRCPYLKIITHNEAYRDLNKYLSVFMPSTLDLELEKISPPGELVIGRYKGLLFKAYHTVPTYGVIVREESMEPLLIYTSDTRFEQELLKSIPKNPRIIFIEATLPSGMEEIGKITGHLTVAQAIELASWANPLLMVPMHLSESSLAELTSKNFEKMVIPKVGLVLNL